MAYSCHPLGIARCSAGQSFIAYRRGKLPRQSNGAGNHQFFAPSPQRPAIQHQRSYSQWKASASKDVSILSCLCNCFSTKCVGKTRRATTAQFRCIFATDDHWQLPSPCCKGNCRCYTSTNYKWQKLQGYSILFYPIPSPVETSGVFGSEALQLFQDLGHRLREATGEQKSYISVSPATSVRGCAVREHDDCRGIRGSLDLGLVEFWRSMTIIILLPLQVTNHSLCIWIPYINTVQVAKYYTNVM